MNNLVNISDLKEDKRRIEREAFEIYGIVKTKDYGYIFPEVCFKSNSSELSIFFKKELKGMCIEELLEKDVIAEINKLVTIKQKSINIMIYNREDDMLTFDIFNSDNSKSLLIATPMEYNSVNKKIFTAIIAGAIKKSGIDINFLTQLRFNEVKELIKNL